MRAVISTPQPKRVTEAACGWIQFDAQLCQTKLSPVISRRGVLRNKHQHNLEENTCNQYQRAIHWMCNFAETRMVAEQATCNCIYCVLYCLYCVLYCLYCVLYCLYCVLYCLYCVFVLLVLCFCIVYTVFLYCLYCVLYCLYCVLYCLY